VGVYSFCNCSSKSLLSGIVPGSYTFDQRITPCASTTNAERLSMPRSSLKTP
jgi:hypothetical protein